MTATDTLNAWAAQWATFMLGGLTDTIFLLAFVALVWLLLRRWASAQLGYCLFSVVLLKLLIPISIAVPPWAIWLSPRHVLDQVIASVLVNQPDANLPGESEPFGLPSTPHEPEQLQPPVQRHAQMPTDTIGWSPAPGTASEPKALATITPAPPLSLSAKLMLVWSVVVFSLLVRFGWVQRRTRGLLRQAQLLHPASLPVRMEELCRRAGVRRSVQLSVSAAVSSPAVWGLMRPHLVLPPDFDQRLTPKQLSWLLLHELAHIRRGDLWVAALQRALQIIYFFNPAVWLANWVIDQQREYACDDAALAVCECPRRDCGKAFLAIVERASALSVSGASALGVFNHRVFVRKRLTRILDKDRRVCPRLSFGAAVLLLTVAAIVLPCVHAQDQTPDGPGEPRKPLAGGNNPQGEAAKADAAVAALREMGADVGFDDQGRVTSVGALSARIKAKLNDETMKHLESLPGLKQLGLRHMAVTNAGLAHAQGLANLEQLDLGYTQVTDDGLVHVKALAGLKSLELANTQIADDGLTHLRGLTNLEVLDLTQTRVTDAGLTYLRPFAKLNSLSLLATTIGDAGLRDLGELTNLTSLNLGGTLVGDAGLTHLKRLTNLRSLILWRTQVTDAGLENLRGLSNLETLWLNDTRITDAGLVAHLQGLKRLRALNLSRDHISDAGLVPLRSLRKMEVLLLGATQVSDAGVKHLATLPQLRELALGGTRVTDAGLMHLRGLAKLESLDLTECAITDAGLHDLQTLSALKTLALDRTRVTEEGVKRLKEALPRTNITHRPARRTKGTARPGDQSYAAEPGRPSPHRSLYRTSSLYGTLEVTEADGVRYVFVDGVLQTGMYADPAEVAKECHLFSKRYWLELLPYFRPQGKRCLLIGLGGGLLPAVLDGYGVKTHSVEIDAKVLQVAQRYFGYKQGATVGDGRDYLAATSERYDFIVIDAFAGAKFPYSLGSRECFALTEKRLRPSGVLALNVVSKPTGSRVSASVVQTLRTVYPHVLVYRTDAPEKVQPLICFASKKPLTLTLHRHGRELGVTAGRLESLVDFVATPSSSQPVVLTDGDNALDREWSIETSRWKRRMTDLFGRR